MNCIEIIIRKITQFIEIQIWITSATKLKITI